MKKYLLMFLLCACAWGCAGCAGNAADSVEPDLESAETTETVAITTTVPEATTTVTTTTTADYLIASDMKLEVKTDTLRPSKCSVALTNEDSEKQRCYTMNYQIYEVGDDTEKPCYENADYKETQQEDVRYLTPNETVELQLDWAKRYSDLPDGTYIMELTLERVAADPDDANSPMLRLVARTEFEMDASGYMPKLTIDPEDVNPQGVVLKIKNSTDVGRWYVTTYHLYDESRTPRVELVQDIDRETQLHGNNYMPPGGELVLVYDWSENYGALLEGEYVLEITLLAENEKKGKIYRAKFEIL